MRVQRPFNAGCNEGATLLATPVQRPFNGGATLSPYTPGVAPALGGGVHASESMAPAPSRGRRHVGQEATGAEVHAIADRLARLTVHRNSDRFFEKRSEIVHEGSAPPCGV